MAGCTKSAQVSAARVVSGREATMRTLLARGRDCSLLAITRVVSRVLVVPLQLVVPRPQPTQPIGELFALFRIEVLALERGGDVAQLVADQVALVSELVERAAFLHGADEC